MLINNQLPFTFGIPDTEFIRGDVPMTKEEVRLIALSKLRLQVTDHLLDVGAGTGSISIEAARFLTQGSVTAIEHNADAISLINQNSIKFAVSNISIIHGSAPEDLTGISSVNKVFIGGSSGKISDILDWVMRYTSNNCTVVATAITLDTLVAVTNYCKCNRLARPEIIQVSINKLVRIGNTEMFKAQSPIFIITTSKI